jgi:hypothetical protein
MARRTALALLLLALPPFALLAACEQRYSGDAPAAAPSSAPVTSDSSNASGLAAVLALGATDASAVKLSSDHAMIVTNCAWPSHPCAGLESAGPDEGSYRVIFGSGHGSVRSRGQTISDLYREMRDKTSSGQRLDIEARNPTADGGVVPPAGAHGGGGDDPISRASFVVLSLVDNLGEAVVDALYNSDADQCVISVGRAVADAGAPPCLVRAPERPKRLQTGTGLTW